MSIEQGSDRLVIAMAYVVSYACRHHRKALQLSYTAAVTSYCQFFDSVWIVPGTLIDD